MKIKPLILKLDYITDTLIELKIRIRKKNYNSQKMST
jgi:hypothetical protein